MIRHAQVDVSSPEPGFFCSLYPRSMSSGGKHRRLALQVLLPKSNERNALWGKYNCFCHSEEERSELSASAAFSDDSSKVSVFVYLYSCLQDKTAHPISCLLTLDGVWDCAGVR